MSNLGTLGNRYGGYLVDVIYSDKDKQFLAYLIGVRKCSVSAFGKTFDAALKELDSAWALVKEDILKEEEA